MLFFKKNKNKEFKKWHMYVILIIIAVAIGYKLYQRHWSEATVVVGGQTVPVLLADTYFHRLEGWSNKDSMGKYGGMLFLFPSRDQHTMVMRKMRFPLDIVWLNGVSIVDIAPNISPDPAGREADLTPYAARLPSTAVLELPAGFSQKFNLKVGDKVKIGY